MMGPRSRNRKILIWVFGLTFTAMAGYPIIIWLMSKPCTGKRGYINEKVVASYRSVDNLSKTISIKRFMSTEYLKYPFFNKRKFEFYVIHAGSPGMVGRFQIEGQIVDYEKNKILKVDKIPETIQYANNKDSIWLEYKIFYIDETLIKYPEPSLMEMLEYGPTIHHALGICD